MEQFRPPGYYYLATSCTGRRSMAAVLAMARCSPSTPMVRGLRPCTASQQRLAATLIISIAMDPSHLPECCSRATRCMGRRLLAELLVVARCSPSTPTALVFRSCIVSRQPLFLVPTAAGDIRGPDWSYRAAPFVERPILAAVRARAPCF